MTGKILSEGESSFEKIRKGVGEVLFERADIYANNTFQIDALTGTKETFANVKLRSTRLAISLQKLGVTSEDVVVTCLKITMDTVIPHLAILYLGAKYAGIDQMHTETDWRHCLGIVKPKVIFVDENQSQKLKKCLEDLEMNPELIVYGESTDHHRTFEDLVQPCPEEDSFRPKVIKNCRDTAVIYFSSGTTGLSKAMALSHFSVVNGRQLFLEMYGTKFFNVELLFSSYSWITCMLILVRRFFTGGCLVLFSNFHPEDTLRAIEKYKVSSCFINPTTAQQLLKVENIQDYDLSSVKVYISGGTSISPEHLSRLRGMFRKGFVLNTYGCTEAGGCITKNDFYVDLNSEHNLQTVGRCLKDTQIKIIDVESRKILGPNQPGEVWVKSLYGMSGYYNNTTPSNLDQDGFCQTGDIGYYDENEYIYINGRSNDMFKYGSLKVVPEYWESVLQSHPKVHEAAVFGIPHGSVGWLPAACIVLKKNVTATVGEIEEFFNKEMTEKHRLAGGIRFVEDIPKTSSFKLRRRALLDVYTAGTI